MIAKEKNQELEVVTKIGNEKDQRTVTKKKIKKETEAETGTKKMIRTRTEENRCVSSLVFHVNPLQFDSPGITFRC